MATGDLKGNMRRLQSKLKAINYPKDIDVKGFSKGLAQEYLPLLHFILLDYSRPIAELIINNDMELYGKNDNKFVAAVYKVLRDIFQYKPSITRHQFFSRGFAEHKIMLMVDMISMITNRHKELCKAVPPSAVKTSLSARMPSTQSREQVFVSQSGSSPDQSRTPDLITTSQSEIPVFLPMGSESKVTDRDIGYHTAETSPTSKSPEEEEAEKRASVSVNELCAKFESKVFIKHDSTDSKWNDLDENPVILELVQQIVKVGEHFEELKNKFVNMEGYMVLLQQRIHFLESKVGVASISVVNPVQSTSSHTCSASADLMSASHSLQQDSLNATTSPLPRPATSLMHPSSTPTYEPAKDGEAQQSIEEAGAVDIVGLDQGLTADDEDEGLVDDDVDLGEYIVETTRDYSAEGVAGRDYSEEGVVTSDSSVEGVVTSDYRVEGVAARDYSVEGVADRDNSIEGVAGRNYTVQGAATRDYSVEGVAGRDYTVEGVAARDYSIEGVAIRDYNVEGVATRDNSEEGVATRDHSLENVYITLHEASGGRVELGEELFEEVGEIPVRDVDGAVAAASGPVNEPQFYSQIQRVEDMLASTRQMLQGDNSDKPQSSDEEFKMAL